MSIIEDLWGYTPAGMLWDYSMGYGVSAWAEDLSAAVEQAETWVAQVAAARGWSSSLTVAGQNIIAEAADSTGDPLAFWAALSAKWASVGKMTTDEGWTKLGETFAQAVGTTETVEEGREAAKLSSVVSGAVENTTADVQTLAPFVLAGAALVGLAWLLK